LINLGNPNPLEELSPYTPFTWHADETIDLPINERLPQTSLVDLINRRRSHRQFGKLSLEDIGSFLWLTSRQDNVGDIGLGFNISQRPCPSAGAIHPIHILLSDVINDCWQRYDPVMNRLERVSIPCRSAILDASKAVPVEDGLLFALVAEPGKTAAKYADPDSLIWRDAGVILGYFALAAELLELNFCPLGMTGDQWVMPLDKQGRLRGVGLALLGARLLE
jgi:hypothetical protein